MPRLNVNIDHVATVRQARGGIEPDPVFAAYLAELAGANGIVVHLREDRRHIQDRDLRILRQTVKTKLNLEIAPTREMMEIALEVKPDMVTLVPEKRQEITTEGGLDVLANTKQLLRVVGDLKGKGLFVSLFIDPDIKQIKSAKVTKADMLEIHTGGYTEAKIYDKREKEFKKIEEAVKTTLEQGLKVAAGHGLNYINVKSISSIVGIEELNIGHSIIARSVFVGVERAVREMLELCK
ncbi:MAG: pyridoxine 5'-phosphate synthase, pyridoxine 5-phosphate synthase [Candidatus Dadabacteria bacterium CSP1-2]|jgi:pyridoxine 5-phosphate synthase|nr:MAG: pyridoxine 5'-phosphate synthase, pyridoxine 5-phosphate synthase [Candidatus Dadabacteria bacterium CSP1-2]OGE23950.1 MAG: pyridoxine 5'-phosphate synthase [Candidatus Dadabacteria bacterium RBG_19FT_COMBO_40_33]